MSQLGDLTCLDGATGGMAPFAANVSLAQCDRHAFGLLASLAHGLGFENLCMTVEASSPRQQRWSTLDHDTQTCLLAIGFDGHDPVRRFARRTSDPFIWSRGDWPGDQSSSAREIMANLPRAAIEAGMSVAVWGRAGRIAIVDAFASEDRIRSLEPRVADMLFLATAQTIRTIDRLSEVDDMPVLTPREVEVLELAAHGLDVRSIAARLRIVEPTVKFHFKGIRQKLKARTKAEAIARFVSLRAPVGMVAPNVSHSS